MSARDDKDMIVVIRKRQSYSAVPDAILEHPSLSHPAVRALSWAMGRPNNWELRIGVWRSRCKLSDHVWRKVRKELTAAGFFKQRREQGEGGKIAWRSEIYDEPQD